MIIDGNKKVTEDEKWLRGLLCNGTMDCENDPKCPLNTDGCVVDDIMKWHKESIQHYRKDIQRIASKHFERLRSESIECDKKVMCALYEELLIEYIDDQGSRNYITQEQADVCKRIIKEVMK